MSHVSDADFGEAQALVGVATNAVASLFFKSGGHVILDSTTDKQRFLDEAVSKLHEAQSLMNKARASV